MKWWRKYLHYKSCIASVPRKKRPLFETKAREKCGEYVFDRGETLKRSKAGKPLLLRIDELTDGENRCTKCLKLFPKIIDGHKDRMWPTSLESTVPTNKKHVLLRGMQPEKAVCFR